MDKIKERKLSCAMAKLESYEDGPYVFKFKRGLLTKNLSLGVLGWHVSYSFHEALLKLWGEQLWTRHANSQLCFHIGNT
jgi:hypothetical protein